MAGRRRKPACLILEAVMTGVGIVLPEPAYLEAARDITRRHGVVLIFDEVKTGLTIAAGGAVERFGVQPDMVTLAKALGGGLASGAIGIPRRLSGWWRTAACGTSAPSTATRWRWRPRTRA